MDFQMESAYEAKKYENSIYKKWEEVKAFEAEVREGKDPFVISMPPPNATGTLHLGHATFLALQDIMIRYNRMKGKEALWLPGTDHAAIATQSVVERKLQDQGVENPRQELGREKLLDEIRAFVEESKDTIRNQVRKMGASCDWSKEKYTLDEDMNHAVNTCFKHMFEDGLIYRGGRIVNWDPNMQTTVADDEVEYKEEKAKFYYFQYGPVVIGTARPETKFKDKIIVVHPDDERYKDLIGKEFEVEWIDGPITAKVIGDECVDPGLGTGAMTITPAHSLVDFELAQKYDLESPQIIDFEGKIREDASKEFGGMPISEAREKIVEKLSKKGLVVRVDEEYVHNISLNYRGKGVIEPQIMKQWFVDVNKKAINWKGEMSSIKEVLQDCVRSKMIEIVPERFEKTYFHWIDNLRDWCISRQIWWGHQIPVWYEVSQEQYDSFMERPDASSFYLEILKVDGEVRFSEEKPKEGLWIRDPDTLDTWFSSALWTFATLGWPDKTERLEYFHPTDVLETGYDILFFWVARMILSSTYCLRRDGLPEDQCIPFKTVYLHGLIRDRRGKKMSKSNPETCIDPLDMIEKYGADALRLSLVIGSTPGNDMRLYEEKIAGYRNFVNKIWNASRFAIMNLEEGTVEKQFTYADIKTSADKWILTELQKLIAEIDEDFAKHRYSDAGNRIYEFLWNKFCDWYLEMSKGEGKNPVVLLHVQRTIIKLLHPFTPFVTEKIWEFIGDANMLITSTWPEVDENLIFENESAEQEKVISIISEIRKIRADYKVEPAKKITAQLSAESTAVLDENKDAIMRMARLENLSITNEQVGEEDCKTSFVDGIYISLPLKGMLDTEREKKRLEKEIENKAKFVTSLEKKLLNPGFTDKAPAEVIEKERSRLAKAKEELTELEKQLHAIS